MADLRAQRPIPTVQNVRFRDHLMGWAMVGVDRDRPLAPQKAGFRLLILIPTIAGA